MTSVSFVANFLGVLFVFGTLRGVMVSCGDWMAIPADGGSGACEKILARCQRAESFLAMGGKVVAG